MTRRRLALILVIVLVAGAGGWYWWQSRDDEPVDVKGLVSYEECVEAGYPVTETDPPQCRTSDGRLFTGPRAGADPSETPAPDPDLPPPGEVYTSEKGAEVEVTTPKRDAAVGTKTRVEGSVPGYWVFEASFGIEVRDANGKLLGEGYATVLGDWRSEANVGFEADVEFSKAPTGTGTIVLVKANPAGTASEADSVAVPVTFKQ